tara:strand:- start:2475 stop:3005 length:531 start_codon:yes stop_codon:yes gene_type:complete
MKEILFYITLIFCSTLHSQDEWTLYPKKEALDSLNIKSTELSKLTHLDSLLTMDTSYSDTLYYLSSEGSLLEYKDSKIESINNYLSKHGKYNGYTVQLYVSQKTDKIRELRSKFISNFPEMILFDEYIAPNIFLYSGKFQDYNNAVFSKMKLEEVFDNTLVVRKSFSYYVEKKMED